MISERLKAELDGEEDEEERRNRASEDTFTGDMMVI
jgi:hypothetical protein